MIKIGLASSFLGAVLLLAGPLGTRVGMWSFIIGFLMLGLSVLLALVGASLGLVAGIKTGSDRTTWRAGASIRFPTFSGCGTMSAHLENARGVNR